MTWIIYWRHWHIAGRGTVLVAVLILSAWPVAAQDIGESSAVTEAFTIGDVTPSLPSAAVSLGAGNAAKVRSVPVSARGTYTTSIPIQVPPGRLGMTPSLALTYDSGAFRQDSAVGAGWALAIPRISRSTLYGFPKLKQTGDGFIYDEDQTRFEASGGEMVALESAAAKPRAVYNDAVFYAPLRETEPVRYEYSFGQNAWVEHRPDGVKRYYGRDGNRQARIRNELGTAAWLLLREVDRHGNAIRYDYHFSASQNRADKFKPQDEPMLSQVSWGGHLSGHDPFRVAIKLANSLPHGAPNLMHGNTQTLGEVSRIVVCGPEQSFPRASGAPFSLSKSSSDCPDSLYWTYELRIKNSDDTGRKLLTQVRRTNPWSDPQRIWTMQYQSNGGRVEFASPEPLVSGGDPKDQLLFTRYGDRLAILGKTTERAMHPQETSVGTRFVDLNHDGRTDIVYHPSGLSTPEAGIVRDGTIDPPYNWFLAEQPNYDKFARSRLRTSGGDWTNFTLESLGFQEGTYVPNGRFGYSDLADVDGDGRLDGVYFNAQITDNFTPNRRGLSCFSETFWRTCGAIDPPKSDMCKLSNICEQLGELDMTMCVNGQCWITPSDLESLFKDWANWAQVSVLSQQGQKAVQDHGGSIDFRQKLIRVPAAQLRARLKLALGEKPYVTRVRVLRVNAMQQCEALIKGCAGGKLDGVPGPRISFDFDSTRTKLGWGNQAPSSEPRVLPPLYRMGYHAGGGSPDRVAPTIALLGWPAAVYKATMLTMKDSSSFIESWIAKPVSDFSAPLTDLNGDGLADLTLLKSSQITMASALRPEMEFTPRAFLARRHPTPASNEPPLKMELDWKSFFYQYPDAVVPGSPVSGFTQSLQDILVKPGASYCNAVDCLPVEQLTYPIGPNFNSFLLDLNGDGLPDLVSAVPDMDKKCPAKGPRGHEVFLNRGYRFGISASAAARPLSSKGYTHTDTEPYGPFKILLKRDLDGLGNCQLLLGDSLPMTAAAFTDINADGRLDVVFQWQGISEPISHYVFLNRGTRFQEITRPYGLPSVPLAMISSETLKYPKGTQMGDLARLEDVDNDGLVDMVVAGMFCLPIHPECNSSFYPIRSDPGSAPPWKLVGDYKVFPALVYRNKGTVPDLLTRVEESSGSSAEIRYAPARLGPVTSDWVPPGIQVVKSITSRAGADSSEAVVQLSYENYVKAAESPESLGFERVTAEFEDRDGTLVTGHHRQTRVFDVRPAVSGVSLAYPGKGLVLETSSEADGRRERTLVSQVFLPHGAGVSIRVDATDNLSCTLRPDGSCNPNAHTGSRTQTLARDSFGFVTESVVGDLVNGAISNIHRVRTVTTYDHRPNLWVLGSQVSEKVYGRSVDINGTATSDAELSSWSAEYDSLARLKKIERPGVVPANCQLVMTAATTEVLGYDPRGFPKAVRTNGRRTVLLGLDKWGLYVREQKVKVERFVDGVQQSSSTELSSQTDHDLRTGEIWSTRDANGSLIETRRDSMGRMTSRFDAFGREVERNIYVDSAPVKQQQWLYTTLQGQARFVESKLDSAGRVRASFESAWTTGVASSTIRTQAFDYDSAGNPVREYLPKTTGAMPAAGDLRIEKTFDGFGMLVRVKAPDGTGEGRVTSWSYAPRRVATTDPLGTLTVLEEDWRGALVQQKRTGGGLSAEVRLERDSLGRLASMIDADGAVRRFEHDRAGRLYRYTLPHAPQSSASGLFEGCHDVGGALVLSTDPTGARVRISYDTLDRPVVKEVDVEGSAPSRYTFSYDDPKADRHALGRLWRTTAPVGEGEVSYDVRGFSVKQSYKPAATALGGTGWPARLTSSVEYGWQGELKSVSYILGPTTGVPAGKFEYQRDARGRLSGIKDSATTLATGLEYDAFERMTRVAMGSVSAGWKWTPESQDLVRIEYQAGATPLVEITHEDFDKLGNPGREIRSGQNAKVLKTHTYDGFSRLMTSRINTGDGVKKDEAFSYSPGGRLLTAGADKYSFDKPSLWGAATAMGSRTLDYDARGNVVSDTSGGRQLHYDAQGCVVLMERASGGGVRALCDAGGSQVYRAVDADGGVSRVVKLGFSELRPDEGVLLHRLPLNGTIALEMAYKLTGGSFDSAASGIVMLDMRGSVVAAAKWSGAAVVTQATDYDAWGVRMPTGSAPAPRHGFVGFEPDSVFGTYAFGRRVYDPTLRRWLSPDPLISMQPDLDVADGRQLDLYGYAANNPVKFTDRTGNVIDAQNDYVEARAKAARSAPPPTTAEVVDLVGLGAGIIPYAGDYVSLGISVGVFANEPTLGNGIGVGLDAIGAVLPFVPAVGTLKRVGEAGDAFKINRQKQAGHIEGTPQYKNRVEQKPTSKWNDPAEADTLTREAHEKGQKMPGNRNERIYQPTTDSGSPRPVGTGPNGGTQMKVKVSEGKGGSHGTPWGEEHNFGP